APVRLIYVADIGKLEHTAGFDEPGLHEPEVQKSYYYVDTGLIAGNVYLFAASRGLSRFRLVNQRIGFPAYPYCSAALCMVQSMNRRGFGGGGAMARNLVQFQKGLSEQEFDRLYGTEELCRAVVIGARW